MALAVLFWSSYSSESPTEYIRSGHENVATVVTGPAGEYAFEVQTGNMTFIFGRVLKGNTVSVIFRLPRFKARHAERLSDCTG